MSVRKGDRIGNHACPDCGTALTGVTMGRSQGRYLCPISGYVVTRGLSGAVELDGPYRLAFQPGTALAWSRNAYYRDLPDASEQAALERVASRVLGPGCIVLAGYDPHQDDDPEWAARRDGEPGLRLIAATDPGDPAAWLVNAPVTYRACAACGTRTLDLPAHRPAEPWRPKRETIWRGRGRCNQHQENVRPGPHPGGALACSDCDPRSARAGTL